MSNSHPAGKILASFAILKHSARHSISLALIYPTTISTGCDTTGILTSMLEEIKSLMEIINGVTLWVGEENSYNTTHIGGVLRVTTIKHPLARYRLQYTSLFRDNGMAKR